MATYKVSGQTQSCQSARLANVSNYLSAKLRGYTVHEVDISSCDRCREKGEHVGCPFAVKKKARKVQT